MLWKISSHLVRGDPRVFEKMPWLSRTLVSILLARICFIHASVININIDVSNAHPEINAGKWNHVDNGNTWGFSFKPYLSLTVPRLSSARNICETEACIKSAAMILKNMDQSIDPCEDFYAFTCGRFVEETQLFDDQVSVTNQRPHNLLYEKARHLMEQEQEGEWGLFKVRPCLVIMILRTST